jgi:hypothetical protein
MENSYNQSELRNLKTKDDIMILVPIVSFFLILLLIFITYVAKQKLFKHDELLQKRKSPYLETASVQPKVIPKHSYT